MSKENTVTIAFVGNPNVGKSTLFNEITGLKQHTGNWTGKTVESARGEAVYKKQRYIITDLPGTYSLFAHSPEEAVTGDFIMQDKADVYCIICDASCLERNLPLVLQLAEHTKKLIVILNLWDEAEKYSVKIDINKLEEELGLRVIKACAKKRQGIKELFSAIEDRHCGSLCVVKYDENIEYALSLLPDEYTRFEKLNIISTQKIENHPHAKEYLYAAGYYPEKCEEIITSVIIAKAGKIARKCISQGEERIERNRRIDKIITGRYTALPIMLAMLCGILYITVIGANYPSLWLSSLFSFIESGLNEFLIFINTPSLIREITVYGVFRVVCWVIAVMLPPMAVFFPLFTILEDAGVLPRIAFNMDGCFRCSGSCGKQALTMCMGFGCNAVGVCGCRIIDSKRERLIAILTNVFVPCNGRFPMLVTLISVFLINSFGTYSTLHSALMLCIFIVGGISITLAVSFVLSKTLLRGIPSSFTLELPPYRMPKVGSVLVRSFLDRTLFVLGRAVSVAVPAGALIWILANISVKRISLLDYISLFLEPFAALFGLDGVILLAFILGFCANEIVLPVIIMGYTGAGVLNDGLGIAALKDILVLNGWDTVKCICVLIFCICHFPCSATLLTVKKETGSIKWSLAAIVIPTVVGLLLCFTVNLIFGA
ncbi:MAG: ferrous iron transport protein B [Clostridia bacterium]|nr:ferrous iron transport protein B [Clostridia bacterium]